MLKVSSLVPAFLLPPKETTPLLETPPQMTPSADSTAFRLSPSRPPLATLLNPADISRPSSAQSFRIRVDRPTTPEISARGFASSPRRSSFVGSVHQHPSRLDNLRGKLELLVGQTVSFVLSSFFLSLVVLWATVARISAALPKLLRPVKPAVFPWDNAEYWKKEQVVKDVKHYAQAVGFDIVDETVETEDGYLLRMHRVVNPRQKLRSDGRGGFPVLLLHGLFQSSGSFITSEERSLAFWLSEHGGYQVFMGNTRGVFDMGHKTFSRNDPRFWDWTICELAMYDFPALVDYVCKVTGYEKIAFIGHSQGNGLAFISLSQGIRPEVGDKLSCFIALAPAVFAGPLTHGFPFTTLKTIKWSTWKRLFGVLDFIPLMRYSYDYVPAKIFATMGYTMFAFLFNWTDANWLPRRKNKMFRFTPTPVSSASIFWWCGHGGFADRKCTMDVSLPNWFDERFPPLSIFWGGRDYLVLTEPLLERIEKQEKHVKLLRAEKIDASEHCDFYWAADAVEWCFSAFLEDIEKTRPKYPEEGIDS